ncbi:MAG: glycosyltransferase family 39 protein [Planctomycetes bacterium]|nr:glycosyltransferase family 39 protein [Planctomycetota bacterium]
MLRSQIIPRRPEHLALLALVVSGLIAYVNCLSSEFVFDDILFINNATLDPGSLNWLVPDTDLPIKGRPLVGLTFVANYAVGKAAPESYHLFNMAVHLGCALALFGVVRRAILRWVAESGSDIHPTGVAFASALLWMVHPLQTECVNYVSQRTESMAALFILLSLYCAIRSHETRRRSRWIAIAGMTSWAGALCKETAAIGPLLILLYDLTFSSTAMRDVVRNRWRLYLATFSSWIPLAGLLYFLPRTVTVGANADVTVLQYALNQSILIIEYLRLAFWPDSLVIDYGRPSGVAWLDALPSVIAVCSLLTLTLATYRRFPTVGYLGLSIFLLLAPTSSILPINSEVGAERRMYLPLAAIVILVVLGVRECIGRCGDWLERCSTLTHPTKTNGRLMRAVANSILLLLAVGTLGYRTIERNRDYANPTRLWRQAVDAYPENSRAWSWLALEFSRVDPAAAQQVTAEMARRWQDDWSVQFEVAEAYLCLHRDTENASRCFRQVVALDPSHPRARLRLVWLLAGCAADEQRNGQEALAIASVLQAEYPDSPEILDALAIAQAECGEFDRAVATAEAAVANAEAAGGSTERIKQRAEQYRRGQPFRFNET